MNNYNNFHERMFPATSMPDRDWWQALWPNSDNVINTLRIKPGMTVVDLGCGYGYFTAAIARQVKSGYVIGLDLDAKMVEQAKLFCEKMTNCIWRVGDAMELSHLIQEPVDYV
ncbi:MAG TPA: methyltransferase domain-containing protein, partial [Candidatus Babeliales bacterium]|nr:methyltransferase domain-containing protein [Candidatus Babeliales bacterium]